MGLKRTFRNIPVIIFRVFKDLIQKAEYRKYNENLLDDTPSDPVTFDIIIIETSNVNIDILPFKNIQPSDKLGYVRGVDIDFKIQNNDKITVDTEEYYVAESTIIAADALYILLLRKAL